MMEDLRFSKVQLGMVLAAYTWGYAFFQIPGGVLADVLGARRGLALIVFSWGVVNVLVALVPGTSVASPTVILGTLIVLRFLGNVIILGRDGNALVLKNGPELTVVARNSLDDGFDASPAIVGSEMYPPGPPPPLQDRRRVNWKLAFPCGTERCARAMTLDPPEYGIGVLLRLLSKRAAGSRGRHSSFIYITLCRVERV
jgi:MFS family permease